MMVYFLTEPENEQEVCKKIWQPGKCTSLLTKYTYNKEAGMCRPMLYNGCLGNSNSFDSIEECNNTCGKSLANYVILLRNAFEILKNSKARACYIQL